MHIKIDAWLKYFIYLPVYLTGGSSAPDFFVYYFLQDRY